MSIRSLVLAFVAFGVAPTVAWAAPVAPEDLFKLTLLSNAVISPDGSRVLVEASRMNGPKNTYDRSIELVDVASGKVVANVTKHLGDADYAWMPDSRSFVFVRTVEKAKPQLYRYTLATGAITQLTHVADGVSAPVVSHAGDRIALTVTQTDPDHDAYIDFAKAGFTPKSGQKKSDIHTIDQLFFEANGQGYTYQQHQHIWIIDAEGSHPKQLTSGKYSEAFDAWSPDDRTILFDSLRSESVDAGVNDVYTIPEQAQTAVMLLLVLFINYLLFRSSEGILRVIGRQGASILVRIMGIILASLSVELVLSALGIQPWANLPKP